MSNKDYLGGHNPNYYGGLMTSIATGGAYGTITGGGYKTEGSYKSLENYANGIFSTAKEKLIRSIAKDVCKTLKVPASFATDAPIGQVVSKFASVVPDPRNNKKIKANSKMHAEICKTMATAINKTYKADIINENDSNENICQNVSELLYTLFTGLHSEFLTVGADISRIMSNLNILQLYIDGLNTKLIKDLEGVSSTESTMLKDAYKALSSEIKRQHSYLANLSSGVVDPTKKSLIDLVEQNKEFKGLVKDLSLSMGTRDFSDKLSYMLNGTYNVSQSAELVDNALKKLGMSVAEYKNTKGLTDLRNKLYKKLVDKKPTTKNIADLVKSIDIVARSDLSHDDIAAHLSKKGGFIGGNVVGEDDGFSFGANLLDDNTYNEAENVYSNRRHATNKSIERTLANKERTKKKLFQMLNNQIKSRYNKITIELSKIAKKMGHDIKINDSIHTFMRQLSYFAGVHPDKKNLHKALSGYRLDTRSQYIKSEYVTSLYTLSDAADECAKGTGSSSFKELSNALDDLIELIDGFNKNITKSLSDVHVDADREKMGGGKCNGSNSYHLSVYGGLVNELTNGGTYGGSDLGAYNGMSYTAGISKIAGMEMSFGGDGEGDSYGGSDSLKQGAYGGQMAAIIAGGDDKDYVYLSSIKKSIREIEYYYRIANVKSGMAIASSQQKNYTDDYENILGEECGILIDKINQKYQWLTCREDIVSDRQTVDRVGSSSMCVMYITMRDKSINADSFKKKWEGFVFALEYIRSAKVEMIEASQALDLYLSKFTESIQNSPDTVKNFLHLLNNLEVVAKWFTDKSGDNLVHVFRADETAKYTPIKDPHYYSDLNLIDENNAPIKEGIELTKENVKNFIIMIEKSFKSMRALENIILTFSKIHDANKSLMSPGLMFKAFMKYAVASCLGLGSNASITSKPSGLLNETVVTNMKLFLRKIGESREIYDPLEIGETINLDDGNLIATKDSKLYRNKNNMYLQTEEIYTRCIKSLVSKVFVVVGAYSLFHRPPKSLHLNDGLSNRPLRQIMGGNTMGGLHTVDIIPEATELYIRLILLAEWYREVFGFKDGRSGKDYTDGSAEKEVAYTEYRGSMDKIISMIPAFDGIWSGFIKDIFIDGMNIVDGNYTEYTSANIISHINDIYRHYKPKYGANCCIKILENFVGEVNLRYGMIKRSEIDTYLKDKYNGLTGSEYNEDDENDYDLLGYNDTFDSNKIPSRKFQRVSSRGPRGSSLLNKNFIGEMENFRRLVTDNLKLPNKDSTGKVYNDTFADLGAQYAGLDDVIRNVKKRLSKSDKSEHFRIIQSSIMGTEKFAAYDYDIMLMFHETVVNPLTILYSTYKIINDWNGFINVFDCGENYDFEEPPDRNTFSEANVKDLASKCYRILENKGLGKFNLQPYLYFYYLLNRDTSTIGKSLLPADNPIPLLKKIMEKIMYLVCDKNPMCEVKFSGSNGYPMISTDRLRECVETLIMCVEKSIDKFKKILPHNFVSRYEKQDRVNAIVSNALIMNKGEEENKQNVNSLYYIKEHLYDRILCDKYGLGISNGNIALKNIWRYLTQKVEATSNNSKDMMQELLIFNTTGGMSPISNVNLDKRELINLSKFPANRISLHDPNTFTGDSVSLIAKMVMENKAPEKVNPLITDVDGDVLTKVGRTLDVLTTTDGHIGITNLYNYTNEVKNTDSHKHGDRGLIIKFNNLLYNYILMFTEIQSNKIYLPLLQQFVNVLADEVMDYNKNTLDDTSNIGTTVLSSFVIDDSENSKNYKNRILFKTMAAAIRSIVTNKKSVSSANILHFAEDNLINVPDYMKDKMMAYLPIFNKHLNIISSQAKFIKVTLESSSIKMKTSKGDYINSFDKIIKGCYALQGCINSVSNELADIPLYFETYKNSISDYKNRNGHLPFMPLSHTSHLLNNHIRLTDDDGNKITATGPTIQHAVMIGGKKVGYKGGMYRNGVYRGGFIDNIDGDIKKGTTAIGNEVHTYELYDALYLLVELLDIFHDYHNKYVALEHVVYDHFTRIITAAASAAASAADNASTPAAAAAAVAAGSAAAVAAIAAASTSAFTIAPAPAAATAVINELVAIVDTAAKTAAAVTAATPATVETAIKDLNSLPNPDMIPIADADIKTATIQNLLTNIEYTQLPGQIKISDTKGYPYVSSTLYPIDEYRNVCNNIIALINRINEITRIDDYRVGEFISVNTDSIKMRKNNAHINTASKIFKYTNLKPELATDVAVLNEKFMSFGVLNLINNKIIEMYGMYKKIIIPNTDTIYAEIKGNATDDLGTFITTEDVGVKAALDKIDGLLKTADTAVFSTGSVDFHTNISTWYSSFDLTNLYKKLSLKHIIFTFIKMKRERMYDEASSYLVTIKKTGISKLIKDLDYGDIEALESDLSALDDKEKKAVYARKAQIELDLKKTLEDILNIPDMKKTDGKISDVGIVRISDIIRNLKADHTKLTIEFSDRLASARVSVAGGAVVRFTIPKGTVAKAIVLLEGFLVEKSNIQTYLTTQIKAKKGANEYIELYRLTLGGADVDHTRTINMVDIPDVMYGTIKPIVVNQIEEEFVAKEIDDDFTITNLSKFMTSVLMDTEAVTNKLVIIHEKDALYTVGDPGATKTKITTEITTNIAAEYNFLNIDIYAKAFYNYRTKKAAASVAAAAATTALPGTIIKATRKASVAAAAASAALDLATINFNELKDRILKLYTSLNKACIKAIKDHPKFNTMTKTDVETYLTFALDSLDKIDLVAGTSDSIIVNTLRNIVEKAGLTELETKLNNAINNQKIRIDTQKMEIDELKKMQPTKQKDLDRVIKDISSPVGTSSTHIVGENNRLKYNLNIGLLPMPDISNGSESFIYAYGTRGLFSDNIEPNIKLAPGVNNTVDIFNSKPQAVTGGNMDPKLVNDSFVASVHLMRYCTDYIYHKTFLMDNDMDKTTLHYIVARNTGTDKYYNVLENLSCQTARSCAKEKKTDYDLTKNKGIRKSDDEFFLKTYNIIMLINNDNYKESLYRMMKCLTKDDKGGFSDTIINRKKMRIYNILDTNIVPINFHALQRELPYSNIFNYSYTFDELVKEKFGVIYNSYNAGIMRYGADEYNPYESATHDAHKDRKFKFAEDQLVDILIHPYAEREKTNYDNTIYKLMIGADGISSGRPKYLSDQLWNKVLLNTIYKHADTLVNLDKVIHKNTKNTLLGQINNEEVGKPSTKLLYLENKDVNKKGYSEPKNAGIDAATNATELIKAGYERYNTYLIRSIEWFVHLQRCMRTLMKDHLEWVDDAVVTKSNSVASSITEYKNDNVFDPDDF
jgi:hypothetical protein